MHWEQHTFIGAMKKIYLLLLTCFVCSTAFAGDAKVLSGDPLFLTKEKGKSASIEFDYSKLIILQEEGKELLEVPFEDWVEKYAKESDIENWLVKFPDERKSMEENFVKGYNDEMDDGVKIRPYMKNIAYKFVVHVKSIQWNKKHPNYGGGSGKAAMKLLTGPFGGSGISDDCKWEIEVIDMKSNAVLTVIECEGSGNGWSASASLSKSYDDIAEELPDYLNDYEEILKDQAKEAAELAKKKAKEEAKAAKKAAKEAAKAAKENK